MRGEKKGISGYDGYLRHQGQTITKPAIGGPGSPSGLALPPELLSTIHLSIINHSDPLREGWKIEKKCFRISNVVYPWQSHRKEEAWFQAQWKQVQKLKCFHGCGMVNKSLFCVLFIHVINAYYLLSKKWFMVVFKAFRNYSTHVQLELIVRDLHMTLDEWKWKQDQRSRFCMLLFFFSDHSYTFSNRNSTPCTHLNFLSAPQHTAVAELSM